VLSIEELTKLAEENPPLEERVDIRDVHMDMSLPYPQRIEKYVEDIKNPYHFRNGEYKVNHIFTPGERTLKNALKAYLTLIRG
jgi:hypothetical protein